MGDWGADTVGRSWARVQAGLEGGACVPRAHGDTLRPARRDGQPSRMAEDRQTHRPVEDQVKEWLKLGISVRVRGAAVPAPSAGPGPGTSTPLGVAQARDSRPRGSAFAGSARPSEIESLGSHDWVADEGSVSPGAATEGAAHGTPAADSPGVQAAPASSAGLPSPLRQPRRLLDQDSTLSGAGVGVRLMVVREGGKRGQDNHVGPLHLITHSEDGGAAGSFGAWDDGPGTSGLLERYALQTLSVKVTLPPTSAAVTAKSEGQVWQWREGGRNASRDEESDPPGEVLIARHEGTDGPRGPIVDLCEAPFGSRLVLPHPDDLAAGLVAARLLRGGGRGAGGVGAVEDKDAWDVWSSWRSAEFEERVQERCRELSCGPGQWSPWDGTCSLARDAIGHVWVAGGGPKHLASCIASRVRAREVARLSAVRERLQAAAAADSVQRALGRAKSRDMMRARALRMEGLAMTPTEPTGDAAQRVLSALGGPTRAAPSTPATVDLVTELLQGRSPSPGRGDELGRIPAAVLPGGPKVARRAKSLQLFGLDARGHVVAMESPGHAAMDPAPLVRHNSLTSPQGAPASASDAVPGHLVAFDPHAGTRLHSVTLSAPESPGTGAFPSTTPRGDGEGPGPPNDTVHASLLPKEHARRALGIRMSDAQGTRAAEAGRVPGNGGLTGRAKELARAILGQAPVGTSLIAQKQSERTSTEQTFLLALSPTRPSRMPSHSSLIGPMQPPVSGARPRASLDSADPGWRRTAQTMQTTAAPAPAPDAGGWTPLAGVEGRRGAGVWAGPKADAGGGESPRRASRRPSLRVPRRVGAPARNGDAAAGPASGSGDAALAAVGCAVEAGASARGSPEVPPQARSPEPSLRPPRSPSPSHRASGSVGKPPPEVLPGLRSNGNGRWVRVGPTQAADPGNRPREESSDGGNARGSAFPIIRSRAGTGRDLQL